MKIDFRLLRGEVFDIQSFSPITALGLGTALKIFPMLWLPLIFLYPREAKRCLAGLAVALFANIGLATLMYGVDSWSVYYTRILGHMTLFPPLGRATG